VHVVFLCDCARRGWRLKAALAAAGACILACGSDLSLARAWRLRYEAYLRGLRRKQVQLDKENVITRPPICTLPWLGNS